ncbi:MAG: polyketide cyclase [Zetaproteobacteria bacterium CG2_30_46_52]|nr:MAG: polyketide cyclase [Zetaproteobacteria bacterium CG2_30_46_52]
MASGTVTLHRVIKCSTEKLFRAFIVPDAIASWIPPYGFTCNVEFMDVKIGGSFRMSFTNFTTGHSHAFGGQYLEIEPARKLVYTDTFDDPNLPGQMMTTVTLKAVACGTSLDIQQTGIPSMIPVEMCYLGWQESLAKLAALVEPEIND